MGRRPQADVGGAPGAGLAPLAEVLAMLAIRASDALPGWLAGRLRARSPGARTRLLRIFPARAARIKDAGGWDAFSVADGSAAGPPVPVGMDLPLSEAVRKRSALTVDAAATGSRLLAVFEAAGEARYVVELRNGPGAAPPGAAAGALVAVARSYYERLVEGETDPLTRLSNRRLFHAEVDAGIRRWTAPGSAYHFAMLDIDHFKRVNDGFGHLYGDEILVHFANLMRRTFRAGDQLYRFGGEEFVVVFGGASPGNGRGTLERFRAAVEEYDFPGVGRVTVSIGYTRIAADAAPSAVLIDRADAALYYGKANGRNQVNGWDELVASGAIVPRAPGAPDVTLF